MIIIENKRRTNPKGQGAANSKDLAPNKTHLAILQVVQQGNDLTKSEITSALNETAQKEGVPFIAGCSVSGRLSELCGAGYVTMQYKEVEVREFSSRQFRFKRKPVWHITKKGLDLLKEKQRECSQLTA